MKILFDTNVILDILLDRQPFSSHAIFYWRMLNSGKATRSRSSRLRNDAE